MTHLRDLRHQIHTGRTLYRKAWPRNAGWKYHAPAGVTFVDRETHHLFWIEIMQDGAITPGIPAGLTREDVNADDWDVLY